MGCQFLLSDVRRHPCGWSFVNGLPRNCPCCHWGGFSAGCVVHREFEFGSWILDFKQNLVAAEPGQGPRGIVPCEGGCWAGSGIDGDEVSGFDEGTQFVGFGLDSVDSGGAGEADGGVGLWGSCEMAIWELLGFGSVARV